MTIIQELVANVLNTRFEDLDRETVDYAKNRIIDTVGALIGGVHSSGADMMLDLVKEWGGKPESTILGVGDRVPAANAVLAMGIMSRSNDFEPGGGPSIDGKQFPGHYSATMVPTAFAMAEKLGMGGKELMTALILGDDVAGRIGVAGAAPWDIGWDPAGLCNRFGATAVAGKLMGLNETQMLNALGIVLNQIGGTMQCVLDYTHSFKMSQGVAGWDGILSAELARRGFTGPQDPLTSQFGYFHQFSREVFPEIVTRDLGKKFYADCEFKLYPCCRGNAGSVESTLKLVGENDINPEDIAEITIDLSPMWEGSFLVQPFKVGPCVQSSAILNVNYNVASVLLRKNVVLENYTDEAIRDPKVVALAGKIKINPTVPGGRMASRVRVLMKDGREISAFTEVPRGDLAVDPLTRDEIKGKFRASVDFSKVISCDNAEKALGLLDELENLENMTGLVKALIPA
ncbi:MmgE/PrpD family protein [Chloroflexota bacterium]